MRTGRLLAVALAALAVAGPARAGGGSYVFDGGTGPQRAEVKRALDASAFPWSIVPGTITIHLARGHASYALPGHIWLDSDLLRSGSFAWGSVQHEYAHEVDFLVLDSSARAALLGRLGGAGWWAVGATAAAGHSDLACERFASTLAWAYWQSAENSLRPSGPQDEAAALAPAQFRTTLAELLGRPDLAQPLRQATAVSRTKRP